MQKIVPFLWFDNQAEEAVSFYTSIFNNSKIVNMTRFENQEPNRPGTVTVITFQLEGQDFMAINGGPEFRFSQAISLYVSCKNQEEVDRLWDGLSEGGEQQQCGWLKDKYGMSWQIVPSMMGQWVSANDPEKRSNFMKAMLQMKKLDIQALKDAYEGVKVGH